jgi:Flp pilus assembly CpaF family ATPase
MVVAIQDSDELDLGHLKYVQEFFSFEDAARALGMRADGTMSDLIEITKVARADRILLGEVRGREAFDFLEAASIFRGNMTTLHANSAIQAINNIVVYALRHPNAQVSGLRSVQEMVAKGVDLLVQVDRVNDRRVVTQVVALDGTVSEDGSPRRVVLWNYDTHTGTWVKPADSAGLPDSQERLSGRLAAAGLPDYWRHPELIGS